MKKKQIVGIVIAAAVFLVVGIAGVMTASSLNRSILSLLDTQNSRYNAEPLGDSVAVVDIVGTIGATSYDVLGNPTSSYDQDAILELIDDMKNSDSNKGLFLYIDSGGGAVYQSDEVYLALMDYKEATGRPIYAYAADTMASGAYYIACAADKIFANRNSTVGSIGVYIQLVNYSGLYEKLGIDGEYIKSGANKAMGNSFDALTDEQRAIYQGVVDECYNQFLDIVCASRGFTRSVALPTSTARIYTASQGLANGLIDDADGSYEDALDEFMDFCGASNVYSRSYSYNSWLSLLSGLFESSTKSETERALEMIENSESGVPMYYYAG